MVLKVSLKAFLKKFATETLEISLPQLHGKRGSNRPRTVSKTATNMTRKRNNFDDKNHLITSVYRIVN